MHNYKYYSVDLSREEWIYKPYREEEQAQSNSLGF